jgi:hypothetical protein
MGWNLPPVGVCMILCESPCILLFVLLSKVHHQTFQSPHTYRSNRFTSFTFSFSSPRPTPSVDIFLQSERYFADALQQGASQFEQQAGKLKRKFWLQNLKVSPRTTSGTSESILTKNHCVSFSPADDDNHGDYRVGHINYHCQ